MSAPETESPAAQPTVTELIDLAWAYVADGALLSAARCLREAADQLEARGNQRNRMLDGEQ